MTDQERWENVISALELCTSEIETRTQVPCEKCHYHNKEYHGVHGNGCCKMRSLQCDILALLKAQEPREMTWQEIVDTAPQMPFIWLESKENSDRVFQSILFKTFLWDSMAIIITVMTQGWLFEGQQVNYGRTWRCWTSHPDQATREATPWN